MKRWMAAAVCLAVAFAAAAQERLVVASWNVENLFDAEDDPGNKGDDEYTPRGAQRWTKARYEQKLSNLASVIAQMKPDVLCLSEVENRRVLDDLARCLEREQGYALPEVTHREGRDARGIEVAVMSKFKPSSTYWMTWEGTLREILVCDFKVGGKTFTVIANHWRSQLGPKEAGDRARQAEARSVRGFLNGRLSRDPAAAILVTGDFNDEADSEILTKTALFLLDRQQVLDDLGSRALYNLAGGLAKDKRGTHYYARGQKWCVFDSINVTRGMLPEAKPAAPWRVREGSYRVFATPEQRFMKVGAPKPFRRVRNKEIGDAFVAGYSDHFPVLVEIEPVR